MFSKIKEIHPSEAYREAMDKLMEHKHVIRNRNTMIMIALFLVLFGSGVFLFFHVGHTWRTITQVKRNDSVGTNYYTFGHNLLKISSDGVSCVNSKSEVIWNTTFTMQVPTVDICGTTAVVAEQQGTQVYIFQEDGLLGQFNTLLPIEKVRVASQGVVATVLEDDNYTWINFYNSSGTEIAENRTSINDSGYPLDLDLSADGLKMIVSYLKPGSDSNVVSTSVAFYGFDEDGKTELNNQIGSFTYSGVVAPEVFFQEDGRSAVLRSDGFTVYTAGSRPKEKKTVTFADEIVSTFQDETHLGFVFKSDSAKHKYRMKLYNMNGREIMDQYFDIEYSEIKIQNEHIIVFNESEFVVFKINGQKRFDGTYNKAIDDIIKVNGFNRYMIVTQDSANLIWLG